MSRTYRKRLVSEFKINGEFYNSDSTDDLFIENYGIWYFSGHRSIIGKKLRDKKQWYKPPKEFKQANRRWERSKVKQAIRNSDEIIPTFKKSDMWEWN